jgi:hypothetical protein
MTSKKSVSKKELLTMIGRLKKDPDDWSGIVSQFGLAGMGAVAGGAAAAVLGAGIAPIPSITALTGFGVVVAAPAALVGGAAVAGGAVAFGAAKLLKGSGYNAGKRNELLRNYQDQLREISIKERARTVKDRDKSEFCIFLEEPLKLNLISPQDAQKMIEAVQQGTISLTDAYNYIGAILKETKPKK